MLNIKPTNLVWIDLEMTGLDPTIHHIVEMATIITDDQLRILEDGISFVIHQPPAILDAMDPVVKAMHAHSGLDVAVQKSSISLEYAVQETLTLIRRHCVSGAAYLSGNSIWQDRRFLQQYCPEILDYLHYRMIDVSSVKELICHWFAKSPHIQFKKKDAHRALDDVLESIQELEHYRKYFFCEQNF